MENSEKIDGKQSQNKQKIVTKWTENSLKLMENNHKIDKELPQKKQGKRPEYSQEIDGK